uniref:Transmembrane protein n=1 Tax=Cacopsylla melanoneura TaxID=428564 RepID=A0A8D8T3I0_9HEMI
MKENNSSLIRKTSLSPPPPTYYLNYLSIDMLFTFFYFILYPWLHWLYVNLLHQIGNVRSFFQKSPSVGFLQIILCLFPSDFNATFEFLLSPPTLFFFFNAFMLPLYILLKIMLSKLIFFIIKINYLFLWIE